MIRMEHSPPFHFYILANARPNLRAFFAFFTPLRKEDFQNTVNRRLHRLWQAHDKLAGRKPNFFRVHLSSLLFVTVAASLLLYANMVLHGGILDTDIDHASQFADGYREFGWPLVACYACTEEKHTCLGLFNFSMAGWDILFKLSILALVVIPLEWAERRRPWLRWHVAAGMALFVAMEILLLYDQCLDVLFALSVMASPILAAILIATVLVTPRIERSACSDRKFSSI